MSSSPLPPEAGPALMRRVALRYIDAESGAPRKIVLDKNTHLGRARFPKHLSPRELPEVFKKAEIAVVVDAGDRNISRNHALLVQEGESWTLYDLNSMNGTAVNGERLDGGKGRPLGAMDRICFGARTKLVFSLVDAPENSALLVGNPGWFPMLRGVKNDLCSMEGALEVRKQFGGNISRLYEASATREAILGMLDTFASINSEDSVFVFYYSGHGSPGGLDVCKGTLSPDDLYGSLGNMRGKKLVLLDSCHSSSFLTGLPPHCLVISGESSEGRLYEGPVTGETQHGIFRQGHLTRAFIKLLEENDGEIDLKAMAGELGQYHRLALNQVGVFVHGSTLILNSKA